MEEFISKSRLLTPDKIFHEIHKIYIHDYDEWKAKQEVGMEEMLLNPRLIASLIQRYDLNHEEYYIEWVTLACLAVEDDETIEVPRQAPLRVMNSRSKRP